MTTEVIMERDADGVTKIDGVTFQVPTDRTALSMLTTKGNRFEEGDRFDQDGWVYKNGAKVRKWFISLGRYCHPESTIWEPKLKNVAQLESRRWHFRQKATSIINPLWDEANQKLKAAGTFKGHRKFPKGAEGYVIFNRYTDGVGISWGWCREEEHDKFQTNQELADLWFRYEDTCDHYLKPFYLYDAAFMRAVEIKYSHIRDYNAKLHLIVNGRDYWFARNNHKYADSFFVKLASPEDTQVITEVLT